MAVSTFKYFKILISILSYVNTLHLPHIEASTVVVKDIEFSNVMANVQPVFSPDQKAPEFRFQLVDIKIEQSHPPPKLVEIVPGILIDVPNKDVQIIGHIKIVNTATIKNVTIEAYEGNKKAFERTYPPKSHQPGGWGYTLYTVDENVDLPPGRQFRFTKFDFTVVTEDIKITQTLTNFPSPISIDVAH